MRKFIIFIVLAFVEILALGLIRNYNAQFPCTGACPAIPWQAPVHINPLLGGFRVVSDNIYTILFFIVLTAILTVAVDFLWKKISKK